MWFAWMIAAAVATPGPWSPRPPVGVSGRMPAAFTIADLAVNRRARRVLGPSEGVREALIDQARSAGWPVRGHEEVGPDRSVEARWVLDGEVRDAEGVRHDGVAGTAVEIWWQLTDRRHDIVLYEVSTIGWVALGGSAHELLGSALGQVLAREPFLVALEQAGRRAFFERGERLELRRCEGAAQAEDPRDAVVRVGSGAGVVISPDGWVWTTAAALPAPGEPILVHTRSGRVAAGWVAASAQADVALLSLPMDGVRCVPLADPLPHAAEPVQLFTGPRRAAPGRVAGFRLQERPPAIVLEEPLAPGAAVLSASGALVGLQSAALPAAEVLPGPGVRRALRLGWSFRSRVPGGDPADSFVDDPDPGFVRVP